MNPSSSSTQSGERSDVEAGAVIVELVLLITLVLSISLAGLELSRALRHMQIAAALSREMANVAFRECAGDEEEKVPGCLSLERDRVQEYASGIIPGTEVLVSIYQYDALAGVYRLLGAQSGPASHPSRFSLVDGTLAGDISLPVVQSHRVVVISEVHVPFRSLLPDLQGHFYFNPDYFYDATIM